MQKEQLWLRADVLLIARIFPHPCGARKTTTQLTKYPHVLYAKPSNKVYVNDKTKTQDEYFLFLFMSENGI